MCHHFGVISGESMNLEAPADSCSILLVEDNKINQKIVVLMLARFGLTPIVVDSGLEAVEQVDQKHFDLILMDLHMPGMDGLEASRRIREKLGNNCPDIVALTADAYSSRENNGQSLDGFLMKPINSDQLRQCLMEHTAFKV